MVLRFLHMKRTHARHLPWIYTAPTLSQQGIKQDWHRVSHRICHRVSYRISAGYRRVVPLSGYIRSISQFLDISRLLAAFSVVVHPFSCHPLGTADRLPLHHTLPTFIAFRRTNFHLSLRLDRLGGLRWKHPWQKLWTASYLEVGGLKGRGLTIGSTIVRPD